MKKLSIAIIGSYGAGNIGDEVLLDIITKELGQDQYQLTVFSGKLEDTQKRHPSLNVVRHLPFGFKSIFKGGLKKTFLALWKADYVLVGGGGLITDQETLKAVLIWAWHVFWAKVLGKTVFIISNSIDPFKTKLGERIGKWIFRQASFISVRDTDSYTLLKALYPSKKSFHGSDPAFLFSFPKIETQKEKHLAFNMRPWSVKIPQIDTWLKEKEAQGWTIHLIASDHKDLRVLQELKTEKRNLHVPQNYDELSQILAECELALGMRLHFLIAAACMNCKVSALAYSPKVQSLMTDMELPFLLPENWNLKEIETLCKSAKKADHIEKHISKAKASFEVLKRALV